MAASGRALVFLVLIGLPATAWSSLPSTVAWQWVGNRPTTGGAKWLVLTVPALLWAFTCLRTHWHVPRYRSVAAVWRLLILYALIPIGFDALVVWSNQHASGWRRAQTPVFPLSSPFLVVAVLLTIALVAGRDVRAPAVFDSGGRALPVVRTPALWSATATNRRVLVTSVVYIAFELAMTILVVAESASLVLLPAVVLPLLLVLVLAVSSRVRVTVGPAGVAIAFGPLSWPRRYYGYDELREASTTTLDGRYGWRRYADLSALIVRRGEGLRLDPKRGRAFAVTIDDAATAAGLIHEYLTPTRPAPV